MSFPLRDRRSWGLLPLALSLLWLVAVWRIERLWFAEQGWTAVFDRQLGVRLLASLVAVLGTALIGGLGLRQALMLADGSPVADGEGAGRRLPLTLRGLLVALGAIALALVVLLTVAWLPVLLPDQIEPLLRLGPLGALPRVTTLSGWLWVLPLGMVLGLVRWPRRGLIGLMVGLAIAQITLAQHEWQRWLLALEPIRVGETDPLFGLDLGFYLGRMPLLELLRWLLLQDVAIALLAVLWIYLLGGDSVSQARFPGFTRPQRLHLGRQLVLLLLGLSLAVVVERLNLLYADRGIVSGAAFTDVWVRLPLLTLCLGLSLLLAVWLLLRLLRGQDLPRRRTLSLVVITGLLIWGAQLLLPPLAQSLVVQPNELDRQRLFLTRSIRFTRQAFGLDRVEVQPFAPGKGLTAADLQRNAATIQNIRLWDERPLLASNRQLQQLRLYYRFPKAQIDRYPLRGNGEGPGALQQTFIAARELDPDGLPGDARTWVNEHLVYTHGYGFTLSPVNTSAPDGLPRYFIRDLGQSKTIQGEPDLGISAGTVRRAVPVRNPRIYYGQQMGGYVATPSRIPELDYPSGDDNVYNRYDGRGGVPLRTLWDRLCFTLRLQDWRLLFNTDLTADTHILYRREVVPRVQAIAPFLRLDPQPYLVSANVPEGGAHTLFWVVDAYTVSNYYPYADAGPHPFNYLRNAVKVVVDAYDGSVQFYVSDPEDPLIQLWQHRFPELFRPLTAMPAALQAHLRYPPELFEVQSERLLSYHVTDPQVFYNGDDRWQVPLEIYGGKQTPVLPYYAILRLPTAENEEFVLLHPFTPKGRNNLVAWMAGRSDGDNYGRLLLYQFPKQRLVFGPEQIQARINQTPDISRQITLWNREGSRVIEGNLLVIPIEQSLLYVEPLYIEAERNSLPALTRVIVAYGEQIVMRPTLREALQVIFGTGTDGVMDAGDRLS